MGEIVNRTRNIFLDSEQHHSGGDLVRMFLPNDAFSLHKDESMKFIVSSFEMQKKFYNINKHNNTFYALKPTPGYTEIKIKEGDYFQFGENADVSNSLCEAIYNALGRVSPQGGRFFVALYAYGAAPVPNPEIV